MLQTFKPRPLPNLEVDHINGNHLDFTLSNLRWVTSDLNIHFYVSRRFGRAKLDWEEQEMSRIVSNVSKRLGINKKQALAALNWLM